MQPGREIACASSSFLTPQTMGAALPSSAHAPQVEPRVLPLARPGARRGSDTGASERHGVDAELPADDPNFLLVDDVGERVREFIAIRFYFSLPVQSMYDLIEAVVWPSSAEASKIPRSLASPPARASPGAVLARSGPGMLMGLALRKRSSGDGCASV